MAETVTHYENFPVASLLCPPHLRQPIAAIYGFARTADDLADEGNVLCERRLQDLHEYRAELQHIAAGNPPSPRWRQVFAPLQVQIRERALPVILLDDLLDAFVQDIVYTRDGCTYANQQELLDYCRRSANPVGRMLLHLYGVNDARSLEQSDAICSALQLINFWQDLSVDLPRGRHYLTDEDCARFRVPRAAIAGRHRSADTDRLIMHNAAVARALMQSGAPLVHTLKGRVGWELRLVVQGGLRILDKVEAQGGGSLLARTTLKPWDWPLMLWRALWM
ncbi:squalene synthase HpnC [Diaphorobacter aerolatus]|uniref:Squalene synthase HpnC n=1 Tax=Diaphorobacter aerolatus TaxID=1288495 RepID=A0A7H0GQQ2_9BURK|nr:squalene synthase HpnC [Diaphorobacter aerolatus]QNP50618.1 squalene synthase HpnC [Diaphorobacter aerolatus]